MSDTVVDLPEELAAELVSAIRRWHPDDQRWWRAELDANPEMAYFIARLAHEFGATPVSDDDGVANPMVTRGIRPGSLRRAPDEARHLLARMTHDQEDERAA